MVAALFQMLIGFTGLVGFLLRFIGPLTIAPTITLVGLALFQAAADFSGDNRLAGQRSVKPVTHQAILYGDRRKSPGVPDAAMAIFADRRRFAEIGV